MDSMQTARKEFLKCSIWHGSLDPFLEYKYLNDIENACTVWGQAIDEYVCQWSFTEFFRSAHRERFNDLC